MKKKYLKMRDSTAGKSQKSMEQNDLESVWKAAMKKYYWKESVRKMKVLLYAKNRQVVLKSGVGRAMVMQEESLKGNGVEVTTDPKDDYDVVHINTIFPSDYFMAKKVLCLTNSLPLLYITSLYLSAVYLNDFNLSFL